LLEEIQSLAALAKAVPEREQKEVAGAVKQQVSIATGAVRKATDMLRRSAEGQRSEEADLKAAEEEAIAVEQRHGHAMAKGGMLHSHGEPHRAFSESMGLDGVASYMETYRQATPAHRRELRASKQRLLAR
jgi:hypothetical protein